MNKIVYLKNNEDLNKFHKLTTSHLLFRDINTGEDDKIVLYKYLDEDGKKVVADWMEDSMNLNQC